MRSRIGRREVERLGAPAVDLVGRGLPENVVKEEIRHHVVGAPPSWTTAR